jgi:transcriptional regulator with GAF, ATPase, and Fis domain
LFHGLLHKCFPAQRLNQFLTSHERASGDVEHARKRREEIERALTESRGRVGGADGAAARLGINRTTLLSRMKKLGIDPKQFS